MTRTEFITAYVLNRAATVPDSLEPARVVAAAVEAWELIAKATMPPMLQPPPEGTPAFEPPQRSRNDRIGDVRHNRPPYLHGERWMGS